MDIYAQNFFYNSTKPSVNTYLIFRQDLRDNSLQYNPNLPLNQDEARQRMFFQEVLYDRNNKDNLLYHL
mgnify:CR=1 FL=1